jgi:hypothetical protein
METTQTPTQHAAPSLAFWIALFCLLNAGDLLSTYLALGIGMREGNPLMSTLLAHFGFAALIVYKLLVVGVVGVGVVALRRFHPRLARITIVVCNALVFLAVSLNVLQLRFA